MAHNHTCLDNVSCQAHCIFCCGVRGHEEDGRTRVLPSLVVAQVDVGAHLSVLEGFGGEICAC